ncbi:MAG: succinyl-diaminopimelate desuccinylase [Holosporales bacterium]|jgi:succinyl-diaminopimelate desuccinylase
MESSPLPLAVALVRCPSVTPDSAGCFEVIEKELSVLGFTCRRYRFGNVDNIYARIGTAAPNFCFAGHVDVVSPGNEAAWRVPPFAGAIEDGVLWGRGAADMKPAIAAFISAAGDFLASGAPYGSISLLLTADEEGEAVNGTVKVLEALSAAGERLDACLVGEPTNPATLGEMIKVGRRGSLNAVLTVHGIAGHVAYPERAANPVPVLLDLTAALRPPLDTGTAHFQPSNLEITSLDVGNPVTNVIPERAVARFNVRFNDTFTGASLKALLRHRLDAVPLGSCRYTLDVTISGEPFCTGDAPLSRLVADAVHTVTGKTPVLSTSGGTSDARFIARYCPVVEFGGVGATMHKVDERQDVADILALAAVYCQVLKEFFPIAPTPVT